MNQDKANTPHAAWRKSSHSSGNGECVEVADLTPSIGVRDSRAPATGHLTFTSPIWAAFLAHAKSGYYDR
ncbi:DUF397 domain-containing protein [Actinomadura sp. BRA 177]|uniref:DUF397 domain-containing protein n=1 Tax=Actinomadura sp. BRA 177 TaxID=2745202 RepID=UPI0015960886|nr:DUF397 domain-containing protein [Actinomadura sp. BRA 177]NVI90599.1 DUF397 domain-containing protein [Actinomadura sp. BRA 177]